MEAIEFPENISNFFSDTGNWFLHLPWNTVSLSDWIQIGIGILSFIVTVALTIVIYKMQSRHERETEQLERNRRQAELENKADQFLISNEEEIDYLPMCVLASNLHRHDRHTRAIYTNFCRCSDELQNEILKKANYSFRTIPEEDWVYRAFEALKTDIENHQLGQDILYEGAKHFFVGYRNYRREKWEDLGFAELFDPIAPRLGIKSFYQKEKLCLGEYIVEYLHFRYSENAPKLYNPSPIPPIDYLCNIIDFKNADEIVVCAWTMQLVKEISIVIHNIKYTETRTSATELDYPDARRETYEDAYYEALIALYNTYYNPLSQLH